MKNSRRLALLSAAALMASPLSAVDVSNEDIQSLRDWINSKRMITVKELGGQLSISGDIHAEMQASNEVINGVQQRGRGTDRPNNAYDVEFNLNIDYRTENTWAAARVRFDNDAGISNSFYGSGTTDKLKVDRAYFGYRVLDRDRHTMQVELGRRSTINMVFDSRLQFTSIFDGVNFEDSYALEKVGDVYYKLGAFLVSDKKDQAAYVGEVGILNIAKTGFYGKYSLIDWDTKNDINIPPQFHFIVSQLTLGYKFIPTALDKLVWFYAAGLYNHRARPLAVSDHKRANFGGYLGCAIGQIKLAGDWSVEANYQVLAAQCVPDFDVAGVGMGNSPGNSFYYIKAKDSKGKDVAVPSTRKTAEGNVNYRGFTINVQYLLTNNLNILQEWKQSITLDDSIGPFRRYKQYEVDFIYSF